MEDRKPPPISRIPSMVSLGSFRSQSHNEVGLALVRPPNTGQPLSRNNSISSLTSLLITSNGRRANPSARMPPTANLTQNRLWSTKFLYICCCYWLKGMYVCMLLDRSPSISENPSAEPNSNSAIIKHVLNSVAQVTVSKPPPRLASIGSWFQHIVSWRLMYLYALDVKSVGTHICACIHIAFIYVHVNTYSNRSCFLFG